MNQYLTPEVKKGAMWSAIIGMVIGVISVIPFLNCIALPLTCVIGLVLPIGIGWLVGQWSAATDMGKGAISGAFAAGIGGLVSGVVVFVLNVIINVVFSAVGTGLGGDAASAVTSVALGIGGACVSFVLSALFSAIFGAAGGLLYVALRGSKAKPA